MPYPTLPAHTCTEGSLCSITFDSCSQETSLREPSGSQAQDKTASWGTNSGLAEQSSFRAISVVIRSSRASPAPSPFSVGNQATSPR
jgi:hypothetical protein